MSTIVWSELQNAIFAAVADIDGPHLVIEARAGCAKTTTAIGALDHCDSSDSIIYCAFNKAIQTELESRIDGQADCRTFHSVGFGALRYKLGDLTVDKDKTRKIADATLPVLFKSRPKRDQYAAARLVCRLVGLGKNTMIDTGPGFLKLCEKHNIGDEDIPEGVLAAWAVIVINECRAKTATIDFDDMVWLPSQVGAVPKAYDVVFVDEAQDVNPAQLWLIRKMLRRDGRLIAIGDDRQAIYGWRGAGEGVLGDLVREFDAARLPLSITYRCPVKVVELAQTIVPDFQAAPDAPAGIVETCTTADVNAKAKPGDFILSRTNAPLISHCLNLLRAGTPAKVAGRDIGAGLAALIKKAKVADVPSVLAYIRQWATKECARLAEADQIERIELVQDKAACIFALCAGEDKTAAVLAKIDRLFADTNGALSYVVCSTVHRAKGLERDRVWLLADTFRPGASTEESNIWYVGITRAAKALYLARKA